jgi:hypothetical protein
VDEPVGELLDEPDAAPAVAGVLLSDEPDELSDVLEVVDEVVDDVSLDRLSVR